MLFNVMETEVLLYGVEVSVALSLLLHRMRFKLCFYRNDWEFHP